jgi:chromosome segregation ATPase
LQIAQNNQQIAQNNQQIAQNNQQIAQNNQQIAELKETPVPLKTLEKLDKIEEQIAKLKEKPSNVQILQVICVGGNDNYLDMLTQQWGDFDKALEYIKNCVLSNLNGDYQLIKSQKKVIDPKESFWRKLANNLQNSLPIRP